MRCFSKPFLKALTARYPDAVKILLVQDNLNTHCLSALYETFDATEAFALAQRFEFHFTPKSASWLNMIEIEFSALSRQCLNPMPQPNASTGASRPKKSWNAKFGMPSVEFIARTPRQSHQN